MNPKVKGVKAADNYILELEFDNGERGIFSMEPYLNYPVFQPLKNPAFFLKARATMGFVSWDDEIDVSPDTLYLESKIIA